MANDLEKDECYLPENEATLFSNPIVDTKTPRLDHFLKIFDIRIKRIGFWTAFFLFTVALAVASNTTYLYLAFPTSFYQQNTLLSTIGLLTSILSSVIQPFWGRLADSSNRSWCLAAGLSLFLIGYTVCAASRSIHGLAVGQIIYTIGSSGLSFLQTLIIADLTPLRSRGLAYGVVSILYLPFAFIAPDIASGIGLERWRWGYGMFCVILPICVTPFFFCLKRIESRIDESQSVRASADVTRRKGALAFWSADPLGLVLVGTAFVLLLAPLTLYSGASGGWNNPSMIAIELIGGVIFGLFVLWEWKFAPYKLLPRHVFNRNFSLCLWTTVIYFVMAAVYNTYWVRGGSAFAIIAAQTALQASVSPDDLAIAIAFYIFTQSLGGGIGAAIAGSIWSKDLPANLVRYAPNLNATDIISITSDITIARISEPRGAIIKAFGMTYRKIALVALGLMFAPLVSAALCKDYASDGRQTAFEIKGAIQTESIEEAKATSSSVKWVQEGDMTTDTKLIHI